MTTATETKDVLAELAARETRLAGAGADTREADAALADARGQDEALRQELERMYRAQPADFDHHRRPEPKTPGAKIAKQLAEIDLDDAQARAQHARQLQESAKQSVTDYIAAHYQELMDAIGPEAEAVAAEVEQRGEEFSVAARKYLALAQRVDGWRGTAARYGGDPALRHTRFAGIDAGADLARLAERFGEPVPPPTEEVR